MTDKLTAAILYMHISMAMLLLWLGGEWWAVLGGY